MHTTFGKTFKTLKSGISIGKASNALEKAGRPGTSQHRRRNTAGLSLTGLRTFCRPCESRTSHTNGKELSEHSVAKTNLFNSDAYSLSKQIVSSRTFQVCGNCPPNDRHNNYGPQRWSSGQRPALDRRCSVQNQKPSGRPNI